MKDTAGRAGLHVRSSKDYLLCALSVFWYVQLVSDLHLQDMECRSVDVKFINRIPELIALAVITYAICAPPLLQVEQGDTRGMSAKFVWRLIVS